MGEHDLSDSIEKVEKFSCFCTTNPIEKTREEIKMEAVHISAERYGDQLYEVFSDRAEVLPNCKVKDIKKHTEAVPTPDWYEDKWIFEDE